MMKRSFSSTARLWRLADMSGQADDARLRGKTDLKGTMAEVGKWTHFGHSVAMLRRTSPRQDVTSENGPVAIQRRPA